MGKAEFEGILCASERNDTWIERNFHVQFRMAGRLTR